MVEYDERMGERYPGRGMEEEKRGEYADVWENANMEDAESGLQNTDIYGNPIGPEKEDVLIDDGESNAGVKQYETKRSVERGYGGAEKLTSYGLDTAARMYGLNNVLKAVEETDETGRDANNPIGSVYSRLVPNPDERKNLYNQIQKESVINKADEETPSEETTDKLGIDVNGDIFARDDIDTASDEFTRKEVNSAIGQMKKLLDALSNDPRFADLRQRAAAEGRDIVSYITSGNVNPTVTSFFDGLDAANGGSVEEILNDIEKSEAEKKVEEANNKAQAGEEISEEERLETIQAAEKLDDVELNPEMLR